MLCLKKHHLVLILSLLALFVVPFLFSSGSVSATSVSYSYSSAESNYPTAYYEFNATNVGFNFTYVSVDAHTSTSNFRSTHCYTVSNGSLAIDSGLIYVQFNAFALVHTNSYFMLATSCSSDSMTLTFYDYNPLVPQECPECPPIPDTPYGDILNKIYIAILAVSATSLCIYFFYAFYNMFFGGIKR